MLKMLVKTVFVAIAIFIGASNCTKVPTVQPQGGSTLGPAIPETTKQEIKEGTTPRNLLKEGSTPGPVIPETTKQDIHNKTTKKQEVTKEKNGTTPRNPLKEEQKIKTADDDRMYCPDEFTGDGSAQWNNYCYKRVGAENGEGLTWSDSREACVKIGGQLASVSSEEENHFLNETYVTDITNGTWLGMFFLKLNPQGDWSYEWIDGSDVGYTNIGDDDDLVFVDPGNCALMMDGIWYGVECDYPFSAICKREKLEMQSYCDDFVLRPESDECYLVTNKLLNFHQAEDYCKSKGGHLGSILSEEENEFVFKLGTDRIDMDIWIGLHYFKTNSTKYYWNDGSELLYDKLNFKGSPYEKVELGSNACVKMSLTKEWVIAPCQPKFNDWQAVRFESSLGVCKKPARVAP